MRSITRHVAVSAVLFMSVGYVFAQSPVRTYVFARTTTDDATTPTDGRAEATRILIDYFKKQKSKTIAVVESEEVADATVELLSAKPVTGDIQIKPDSVTNKPTMESTTEFVAVARVRMRDSTKLFVRQSTSRTLAIRTVGDDLEKWLKNNRKQLAK